MPRKKRKPGRVSGAWIRTEKRARVYARDQYRCVWCGHDPYDRGGFTLDHLFPRRSRYRDNHARRIVTACHACNCERGETRLSDWLRILSGRLIDHEALAARLRRAREPLRRDTQPSSDAATVEAARAAIAAEWAAADGVLW